MINVVVDSFLNGFLGGFVGGALVVLGLYLMFRLIKNIGINK